MLILCGVSKSILKYNWGYFYLHFNEAKCKTLYLGNNNMKQPYTMTSNNGVISLEETLLERDLGILVDNELSFDEHISEAIKKANRKLAMIKRSFTYLDGKMVVQLYTSLIRPILEYGNVVWSPHLQKHITSIEAVQHRETRLVPGLAEYDYETRLSKLKLPSLSFRRMRGDMVKMYKFCHGNYQVDHMPFTLHRDMNAATTTRDNGFKLWKEKTKTGTRTHFFANRIANIWNTLPPDVVQAPDLNMFKNRLDTLWQKYFYIEDLRCH